MKTNKLEGSLLEQYFAILHAGFLLDQYEMYITNNAEADRIQWCDYKINEASNDE